MIADNTLIVVIISQLVAQTELTFQKQSHSSCPVAHILQGLHNTNFLAKITEVN